MARNLALPVALVLVASCNNTPAPVPSTAANAIGFERVQQDLFSAPGGQPNAWADYDGDGDLDLFVGFRGAPNRLYRNEGGRFVDVAAAAGLTVPFETRAASWGDFDSDGDPDLFLGFAAARDARTRLYRNDGGDFTDVAASLNLDLDGTTRQPAWVDYDQDGDVDLFVANQDGDTDGLYRNDEGRFTDVAPALGMDNPGRRSDIGGVGAAAGDFDNDGDLDLYVAAYGPDLLWENLGGGRFRNAAPGTPLASDTHDVTAAWGDFDNDGMLELYVSSFRLNRKLATTCTSVRCPAGPTSSRSRSSSTAPATAWPSLTMTAMARWTSRSRTTTRKASTT